MLRLSILALALLIDLAITALADTSSCAQVSNLSAAHLSWAALLKDHVDPAHSEESCRSYASNFFEAVTARQAASFCKDGIDGNGLSNCSISRSTRLTISSRLGAASDDLHSLHLDPTDDPL
jgi:hypothetical protein